MKKKKIHKKTTYFLSQEGFEPPTTWFVAMCSSPLSYKLFLLENLFFNDNYH